MISPMKINLKGNEVRARRHVKQALTQMDKLKAEMGEGVHTLSRRIPIDPLGKEPGFIKVYKSFNTEIIEIDTTPPLEEEILDEVEGVWEHWNGTKEYVCIDHLWEVNMRTPLYVSPVTFHSSINDQAPSDYCNASYTWAVVGEEINNHYWFNIEGGYLECSVYADKAKYLGAGLYDYYGTFNVKWSNLTGGGSPGDPVFPTANVGASVIEIAARCWADADAGLGFGEAHISLAGSCAFWATDANSNYWVWFLGIDEDLYNDPGYNPPGSNTSFIGDLGFDVGSSGAPIVLLLSDYGFDSNIVSCGFTFDTILKEKGSPGRNIMLSCEYIDFY